LKCTSVEAISVTQLSRALPPVYRLLESGPILYHVSRPLLPIASCLSVPPETYILLALGVAEQERPRLPVRSALFKQRTGGLVVRWVTTSEYPLLYVFANFFPCADGQLLRSSGRTSGCYYETAENRWDDSERVLSAVDSASGVNLW
jgi:hypothetical protein